MFQAWCLELQFGNLSFGPIIDISIFAMFVQFLYKIKFYHVNVDYSIFLNMSIQYMYFNFKPSIYYYHFYSTVP